MHTPRIAVIAGSTRPTRRALSVAEWVCAATASAAELTLIDLADVALPMLSEPSPAMFGRYTQDGTRRWSELIDGFDGYVLVTPEYNRSTSAALKNAVDHLHQEWQDKPVAFVAYGTEGGVRAVEHLRGIAAELGMAGVGAQVALNLFDDFDQRGCVPRADRVAARDRMLAGLTRWAAAMKPLREPPSTTADGTRPALGVRGADGEAREAVEHFVAELAAGGAAMDPDRFDAMFAADVLWGSPYGRTLAGFADLNAAHRSLMKQQVPPVPPSRFEIVEVVAPAPGVAIAHVRRQAMVSNGDGPRFSEMAMYVLAERDGRWWLAGAQNTPIVQKPA